VAFPAGVDFAETALDGRSVDLGFVGVERVGFDLPLAAK